MKCDGPFYSHGLSSGESRIELLAAKEMPMQVKNRLARIGAVIGDKAVTAVIYTVRRGSAYRQVEHSVQGAVIELSDIAQCGNVLSRHDEEMHQRLRINIAKRDGIIVFSYEFRSKLAGDNATEETV